MKLSDKKPEVTCPTQSSVNGRNDVHSSRQGKIDVKNEISRVALNDILCWEGGCTGRWKTREN